MTPSSLSGAMGSSKKDEVRTPRQACRIPIFAATRKLPRTKIGEEPRTYFVETRWGNATITGRLDQRHRDLLDAVALVARRSIKSSVHGDRDVEIDSAELRRALGWRRWTYDGILGVIEDLRRSQLIMPDRHEISGLVLRVVESGDEPPKRRNKLDTPLMEAARRRAPNAGAKPRGGMLWILELAGGWLRLLEHNETRYPCGVMHLKRGATQAAARFMLSHQVGARYGRDALLDAINVVDDGHGVRHRAWKQIQSEAKALLTFGLVVSEDGMIRSNASEIMRSIPFAA